MPERTPDWAEIEDLFFRALELPAGEFDTWIETAARGEAWLASEVRSLVKAHLDAEAEALGARRIGPYRLERLIGRGGMGEVWLASREDGQFEQRVALKLVRPGLGAELLLPRFRQERQLLARLNHPNITRLLDGGITGDGQPYLAMEYVEGEPILDFCERRRPDLRARLRLFRALCSAVEYAHQNLIVHRDIKPGNVLVTADGVPKLLDFGIAKLVESDRPASAPTLPLVTLRYASPEQFRGEPVTTASDVYSLGVLLFELLTGSLPYTLTGESAPEVIAAVTAQEPLRASYVKRSGVRCVPPGDLDAILAKALEKRPARRYSSVERFSSDIANYLEGWPVAARTLTSAYRIEKYIARHRVGVAAAGLVVLSLAAALVISLRSTQLARQQEKRAERVTQFLERTLASADPEQQGPTFGRGAETKLADLLPSASAQVNSAFAGDPAAQARLHRVLGNVYISLQQFPQAEAESKAALERLPALEDDPGEKAKVLFTAGRLDYLLSHREPEERELRQALETFERTPEARTDAAEHAAYLSQLATALADVGKKQEAGTYADRAVQLIDGQRSLPPVRAGMLHAQLALNYLKTGQLERARVVARASVEELSASPQSLKPAADMGMWLGIIERRLDHPSGALAALEQSAQTAVRALGPNHPLTVAPRIELAYQRALGGDSAGALQDLSGCLAQARANSSKEDLFHALYAMGYVLTLAGRAREGEPLLREALRTGAEFLSLKGPSMGQCDLELGECLERQGRFAEAQPLYQQAYDNAASYYGPASYDARLGEARLQRVRQTLALTLRIP
jgi:serine/threonine protein kinase